MDRLRNHGRASKETTQATPNNDHEMDVDGDIPWEIDGQVDGIQEEPRLMMPDQNCSVQVEEVDDKEKAQDLDPWVPFTHAEEWGLVKWLIAWVDQNAIDEFMKLPIMSSLKISFTSKYSLMKAIDQLPHSTDWQSRRISVEGNKLTNEWQYKTEDLELWMQDPVECIHKLMGNPEFNHMVSYAPERVFSDAEGKTRQFDKMWTGDWWWEMQGRLP
ncbi:hypothetical protein BD769DRAFT_1660647 [Suillus cothurnatus]|nr:hypothetical protein BD769DRAFT_1660647 [Suillus cothurnatus]